jgi:hypothetical protein
MAHQHRVPPKRKALACGCPLFAGSTLFYAFSEKTDVDGQAPQLSEARFGILDRLLRPPPGARTKGAS